MSEREPLTEAQQRVYDFVETFLDRNGFPPTMKEICLGIGVRSTSTVFTHLQAIETKGHLEIVRVEGNYRALRLVRDEEAS